MSRREVEALLDALLGRPWRGWDAGLSHLLDLAVRHDEDAAR